jgi:hypothetical protein
MTPLIEERPAMLTKEQILAASDLKSVPVDVPEWGRTVFVKELCVGDRERWEAYVGPGTPADRRFLVRAMLVALTACDENGSPIFSPDDAPKIADLPAGPVIRLYEVALKVSGVTKADADEMEG